MKKFLKIIGFIILGFGLIQLIPIDQSQKPIDQKAKFEVVENTPPKIVNLLKNTCYNCHSLETKYPNYASIAPISWVINGHIKEARSQMNFSTWAATNPDLQRSMLQNAIDALEDRSMPKQSYVANHPEANINTAERTLLANYFKKVLDSGTHKLK
ncbi:heme-binding domain-containing protein [Frigoriflavimonas asaccharolytica]|uniref:Haem-binding domain-containing protein n=1 Tax=Frigoriflavimonas asaccharolytica TaxID=2735899 RepID=A0A8J8GA78_9FLAO|nr:heme-binding domain-containing protein [Frigoriflavimonas asaccharolytica]NRS92215.1 hypothetical protein [Frigoriflavimonas asaccharolytica]